MSRCKLKPGLRLLIGKGLKQQYDVMQIVTCDDTLHEFKLDEWDIKENEDWLDVSKRDKSSYMTFWISSIIWIRCGKKDVNVTNKGADLKSVS